MNQERIEAAAQALATKDRANLSSWHQEEAAEALAAADAVMFSDEAFGYAVSAVRGQISDLTVAEAEAIARDVISALREDA